MQVANDVYVAQGVFTVLYHHHDDDADVGIWVGMFALMSTKQFNKN